MTARSALGCVASGAMVLFLTIGPVPAPGAIVGEVPDFPRHDVSSHHETRRAIHPPNLPDSHHEQHPSTPPLVDRDARTVSFTATVQAEAFRRSLPPDHQYHAIVHRDGSAARKALFVTATTDASIAQALRELGADDGGGVPMSAWNFRWLPLLPHPDHRVAGTVVDVRISWDDEPDEHALEALVLDPGERGLEIRFGGNEEHDHHWDSGCILCFYSCPGGVLSNAAYTIRDHQRGVTSFDPGPLLPPDGTTVTITLTLVPDRVSD